MENWKDIPNYNGYQVSDKGRVRGLDRVGYDGRKLKGKTIKSTVNRRGYFKVNLWRDCKSITNEVHKLIAMAFLNHKPCGYKIVVDHINGNKKDNRIENLQLITHRENISRSKVVGSSKYVGVHLNKKSKKWVSYIRISGKKVFLGSFYEENDAGKAYQKALSNLD